MIVGVKWTTLVDFPGEVAATFFTHGCNLRCPFCHNWTLVIEPPTAPLGMEEIRTELERRRGFLTAVAFTGGEPLLSDMVLDVAAMAREMGYKTKLDTNGTLPALLEEALGYFDYVAMDLKAPPSTYHRATGVDTPFELVRQSIGILRDSSVEYEFRTTLVPGIVDEEEHMEEMGIEIEGAPLWALQRFVPDSTLDPGFGDLLSIPPARVRELAAVAGRYVGRVDLRM